MNIDGTVLKHFTKLRKEEWEIVEDFNSIAISHEFLKWLTYVDYIATLIK